jgi:hypothetical protein
MRPPRRLPRPRQKARRELPEEAQIRGREASPDLAADYRRRIVLFALFEAAFVLLVLLPGFIYAFVLDNDLSERDLLLYVVGLLAVQAIVTGLLLWKFRILRGPQVDTRDAR